MTADVVAALALTAGAVVTLALVVRVGREPVDPEVDPALPHTLAEHNARRAALTISMNAEETRP